MEDYQAAIATCGQALERDPSNVKALFRRGSAKQALGQTDAARKDLEQALKGAPNDGEIRRSLQALRKEERDAKAATAAAFKGKLAAKSPAPSERTADTYDTGAQGTSSRGATQEVLPDTYSVPGLLLWLWRSFLNLIFGRG
ncbi:uncharacterized protein LOC142356264 [Convolutriloba macropyga]|uniref:uncharacterized protein LOC142356264 n=1 Tax=Convolutriloba macropyga TaxID=536237 RepID=UPI003F520185